MSKKFILLPVLLIGAIVTTSVFTTEAGASLQEVKGSISYEALQTDVMEEELNQKTALTNLSERIELLGFTRGTMQYIASQNAPLALR